MVSKHTEGYYSVKVNAIPVYDGHLIKSDGDLADLISEVQEMSVDLLNDYDVPWIEQKGVSYPKYRRRFRIKKKTMEGEAEDDYDDEEDEDEPLEEEDEEEDAESAVDDDEEEEPDMEGAQSEDEEEKEEEVEKPRKKGKRKKGQKGVKSEEMTQQEKRESDTHMFRNRLNLDKSYFRGVMNSGFDGIAECNQGDEESLQVDESERDLASPHSGFTSKSSRKGTKTISESEKINIDDNEVADGTSEGSDPDEGSESEGEGTGSDSGEEDEKSKGKKSGSSKTKSKSKVHNKDSDDNSGADSDESGHFKSKDGMNSDESSSAASHKSSESDIDLDNYLLGPNEHSADGIF